MQNVISAIMGMSSIHSFIRMIITQAATDKGARDTFASAPAWSINTYQTIGSSRSILVVLNSRSDLL
jgi:hypothetical protein